MLAGSALAAEPFALSGTRTVHERLTYRDLDLSTRQGALILVERVAAAAQNLCAESGPRLYAGPTGEELRCRQEATGRAIAQLGSPLVSAAYAMQAERSQSLEATEVMAKTP